MSDRSFRDRLARIADNIDLEQLDGLVNRSDASLADEEQPSLQRLFHGLEDDPNPNVAGGAIILNEMNVVPVPPPLEDGGDMFLAQIPDIWGFMGGHRTPLTRAIKEGKFELAEKLISSASQSDSLNDGSMTHALTTGKEAFNSRPRNLKIVRQLLEKGASPNYRSPNVLELPSVTPFEVAINYYLDLLKHQRNPRAISYRYERHELMNTIGLSGEDWLDLDALISQAKELIALFIEHGADTNLQTTNSGRTIFHEVMSNEVSDFNLIHQMVTLGALVNLTDVHGTTPFMDLVKNTENGTKVHTELTLVGKRLLIDAQNCTGETVLWRSMFYGRLDTTSLLLHDNANASLMTRVQGSRADYFVGSFGFRPFGIPVTANDRKRPVMRNLPPLLAPLLFDSPCCLNERNKTGQKNGPLKVSMIDKFSVAVFNKVIKTFIAPIVDTFHASVGSDIVCKTLSDLIVIHTDYKHLIEDQMIPVDNLATLLFGNISSGLRQHSIRQILNSALFNKPVEELAEIMRDLQGKIVPLTPPSPPRPRRTALIKRKELEEKLIALSDSLANEVLAQAAAASSSPPPSAQLRSDESVELDLSLDPVTLSEPEIPAATPVRSSTPFPTHEDDRLNRYDENWYLGESPQFGQPIMVDSMDVNVELEISQDSGRQTVNRLQRMLQETDDRLEKLQSQVGEVGQSPNGGAKSSLQRPPRLMSQVSEASDESDYEEDENDDPKISRIWMPHKDDTNEATEPRKKPSASLFSLSPFGKFTPKVNITNQPDPRFDEAVVSLLTPRVVEALRTRLGLPPGLRPFLELEIARLQLGAALFHHSPMKCDRGCEGNDEESDISTTDEDDDDEVSSTTSWDDSLSEPSSNDNQEDSSSFSDDSDEHEREADNEEKDDEVHFPSIPERPRILSSSSSSEEDESLPSMSGQLFRLELEGAASSASASSVRPASPPDFFHFGGSNEHQTIKQFVQQMVHVTFDHSTDSETEDDSDKLDEMPHLE